MYENNKTYNVIKGKVPDFSGIYKEKLLNGADPVLDSEGKLVPVLIGDNGKVTKASLNSKWYKYEDKQWANAVILKDGVETPADNAEIDESNIESYFVWIPKYRYKIWDLGEYSGLTNLNATQVHIIDLEFGFIDTDDANDGECTTPMNEAGTQGLSGEKLNCEVNKWMTHPAFLAFGVNGLWVGKFETSNAGDNKVQIKPNVISWRNINVKTMFDTSYNYQRNLDSHMMKNTEWGVVAYLQHSKYGSGQSVRINNSSNYVTGHAAKEEPTTVYSSYRLYENVNPTSDGTYSYNYTNSLSQVASTTGNYSGIYDMAGGVQEYTMGIMYSSAANTALSFSNSGFNANMIPFITSDQEDYSKYYEPYYYCANNRAYNRNILGDATAEFGPFGTKSSRNIGSWYDDSAWYIEPNNPFFARGGRYDGGAEAGMFAIGRYEGIGREDLSFRIVLAPTIQN